MSTDPKQELGPEFIESFRVGDEHAFDRVFRMYFAALSLYANKFVKNAETAEDIVQDCFVSLWQKRSNLQSVQSIASYLYRAVHNKAIDYLERHKRKSVNRPSEMSEDPVEEAIISAEVMRHILHVMHDLPQRMQQVLRMYYLEEKSYAQIGEEIGIDAETVRTHRYRGIQFIRKIIIPG